MAEQLKIRDTEGGKFALQRSTVTALIAGGFVIGSEIDDPGISPQDALALENELKQ